MRASRSYSRRACATPKRWWRSPSSRPTSKSSPPTASCCRPPLLDAPQHGTLNVHASLLPRWRGAAPVSAAIAAGDAETGATIMLVDETEDTGPILAQRATPIGQQETAGELSDRLAELGAALLIETIPRWLAGEIAPRPQDDSQATRARRVRKEAGRIDWSDSAQQIARNVRAYTPWPGAFTELEGQRVRLASVTAEPSARAHHGWCAGRDYVTGRAGDPRGRRRRDRGNPTPTTRRQARAVGGRIRAGRRQPARQAIRSGRWLTRQSQRCSTWTCRNSPR